MLVSENPCLALAADFTPEGFLPWRDALTSVISKRAYVVEEYDASVASPSRRFRLPAIIARRSQSATLHRPAAFTRANVFLASSELAAVSSALGRIPTMEEYLGYMKNVDTMADNIYRYLNFNEIKSYMEAAEKAKTIPLVNVRDVA